MEEEGAFSAVNESVLVCTWEKEEDDENEGLVFHSTTFPSCSVCIACPLPKEKERHVLPLKYAAIQPLWSADALPTHPLLATR